MPYEFSVDVESTAAAESVRATARRHAQRGEAVVTEQARPLTVVRPGVVGVKLHRSSMVKQGRVFKTVPNGLVVQSGRKAIILSDRNGTAFSGQSRQTQLSVARLHSHHGSHKPTHIVVSHTLEAKGAAPKVPKPHVNLRAAPTE